MIRLHGAAYIPAGIQKVYLFTGLFSFLSFYFSLHPPCLLHTMCAPVTKHAQVEESGDPRLHYSEIYFSHIWREIHTL